MRHAWLIVIPLLAWACGGAVSPDAGTGSSSLPESPASTVSTASDPIFDQSVLHEVRIAIDPGDWAALRENYRENQYYAANISVDNQVAEQVGLRSRGSGSRDPNKPGLKVDFNKYVKDQEFHGYKSLVVDNILQDPSMIRERMAYAVYEAMGIAAPEIAHARLTVNDEYWGVYALIEPVSQHFLNRRFGEASGNLFDYQYTFSWDFSFRGDDPEEYTPLPFQPQTNEDTYDPKGLIDFVRAANEAPDQAFAATMSRFIDVDLFLTYVAVENALAERDGFVGEYGVNNFYLYQYSNSERFVLIPWDKDTALADSHWPVLFNLETNVLTRRLVEDPAKLKVYRDAVVKAANYVNLQFLGPRLDLAYTQIRNAALADEKKPYTDEEFESAIAGLRGLIGAREGDILAQR